ncbi:aminopeptidase N [Copidosoma floridanum]|uniref:aminopeptidase N n=1 Tax=Copidosoma floridanum TaxID=29053 RepID=UPI0006C9C1E1|nr:aminopeptidase N [Copidosoma floridanum]XP_014203653.1 aminopeptidase N [Copidosoma floridanum]XP_014203654.1 aminopeptidase N [Copidosoma floridanum]XP_023246403.1 aminopeptidase N [Copidosoma floridanum]
MRRSALRLGIPAILIALAMAQVRRERSVDLNEQHKLESACICDDMRPRSYDLEIEPRLAEGKFRGHVKVTIYSTGSADKIVLHAHPDLAVVDSDVTVTRTHRDRDPEDSSEEDEKPGPVKVGSVERTARKLLIHLEKRIKRGTTCEVSIRYAGNVTSNDTSGLFAHHYVDATGQKHTYLATYLRLNNARRLFPGYDELQYKTKFRLSLVRPRNMTALANTPLETSKDVPDSPDLVRDSFAETPEMTSHQLAFVISDLERVAPAKMAKTATDGRQVQIRVWGRKEYLEALKNVPDKIVTVVNYLQDYFNRSIELPKLDVVALPTYTASKASDNWGLMLFKESELSSPLVWNTAYELTYQWIGQSITPYRWMDASENKGLNSFLASMTTLDINPEELKGKWPMNILYSLYYGYGKFYGANRGTGIIRDAKFSKIELVFRMFYYILGKENFKASMRHLIQSQATASPNQLKSESRYPRSFTQSDIYDSLSFVANKSKALPPGLTINKVADTWIDQERLPLVTVSRNYDNATITFSQKTYVRENRVSKINWENVYRWNIPLVMQSQQKWNSSDYAPKAWLLESKDKQNLTIPDIADKNNFVVINPEEIGLFPVNYDARNWQLLVDYLRGPNFESIPTLTRAKLLHDAWNLAYADELYFKVALNMTLFLKHEKSHVVWEPFFTMIDHVGGRIEGTQVYTKFQAYARSLLEPMYTEPCESTRAVEPSWKTHLRGLARYFLCRAGYEPCIAEAREQFKKWMTDKEPDKGNPVANEFICPVFKWGSVDEWNFGLQRVINFPRNSPERKQSERTYLLKTLASCPRDPVKVERLLEVAIVERNGNFSDADIHLIFSMLASNANGYRSLFNFLRDKWDVAKERLDGKKSLWTSLVQSATGSFNSQEGYDLVSKLHESRKNEFEGAEGFVPEALEKIKQETRWSENNLPAIEKWLDEHLAKPASTDEHVLHYWKEVLLCPKRLANETAPAS